MIGIRRITRRSFLAAAGLAAVGASLSLTGCSGSVSDGLSSKHLLVAHSHSEAHPVNVGLQKMTEVASAESDLTFSVYPNGQLGDNAAMIQLVKAGVLDIAKVSASSCPDTVKFVSRPKKSLEKSTFPSSVSGGFCISKVVR